MMHSRAQSRLRHTVLGAVVAVLAALLPIGLDQAPAQADYVAYSVTAQVRGSSGALLEGYVEAYDSTDSLVVVENFIDGSAGLELEPGDYRFMFHTFDYGAEKYYAVGSDEGTSLATATVVPVSGDTSLGTVTFATPSSVRVQVVDPDGAGLSDVEATLASTDFSWQQDTSTDRRGGLAFRNVPAGTYNLDVTAIDPSYEVPATVVVDVPDDESSIVLAPIVAQRRASISGTVTGAGGVPLQFVEVTAIDPISENMAGTVTDAAGHYHVTGLDPGSYELRFTDQFGEYAEEYWSDKTFDTADLIDVGARDQIVGKDASLAPATVVPPVGVDLQGTVTGAADAPVPGVVVYAVRGDTSQQSTTDRSGHYVFTGLPAGSYKLLFEPPADQAADVYPYQGGWYGPTGAFEEALSVGVVHDGGRILNRSLQQLGAITGTVLSASGQPVFSTAGAEVVDADGNEVADRVAGLDGSYRILVPAGTYKVRFDGDAEDAIAGTSVQFVRQWYPGAASVETARQVTVVAGRSVTGVNATLTTDLETITAPHITGTPLVGSVLSATTGSWNQMAGNTYAYRWLRGDTFLGGASTYKVTAADVGSRISVVVGAVHGAKTGHSMSAATGTVRYPSTTALSGRSPRRGVVTLTVVVHSPVANPGGTVTVRLGSRVVRTGVRVVNGRAVVKLTKQPAGKRRYSATYGGSATVAGSVTPAVTVRVR